MSLLKMAWRNVWRNSRRSAVTILAMTLALLVEVLYAGLVEGMIIGMVDDVTENDLGDIQIFAEGYLTRPSIYEVVPEHEVLLDALDKAEYAATARLFAGGLAASGEASAGVAFIGVDPVRDAKAMSLDDAVGEGKWLDDADPKGVIIGRGLSRTLSASIGSEVIVLSQAADGSVASDLFTVRGVLMSVGAGTDRGAILMTETTFRELMVFPEGAHKIIVRKPRDVELDAAAAVVRHIVDPPDEDEAAVVPGSADAAPPDAGVAEADGPGLDVMTWKEISPFLATWVESVSGVIVVVYLIIYMAVAILILNAMLMAVFERIREFGVLKAIGYGPTRVLAMMLMEGMLQAAIATVAGLLLAAPAMWYLQVHGIDVGVLGGVRMVGMSMPAVWRGYYTIGTVQTPVIMLFVIVFLAVIYPALKAAWIKPVQAMHHQ